MVEKSFILIFYTMDKGGYLKVVVYVVSCFHRQGVGRYPYPINPFLCYSLILKVRMFFVPFWIC